MGLGRGRAGEQQLTVEFTYDGEGYGRGGVFTLKAGDRVLGKQHVVATPPAFYSIDETFDIGVDTGSPAGRYPVNAPVGYTLTGASVSRVDIELQ